MRPAATPVRLLVTIAATAAFLAPASSAHAVTCDVPSATYPTIQAALDDPSCTVIEVGPGTYTRDSPSAFAVASPSRDVTIRGSGSGSTTVDAEGAGYGFFVSDEDAHIVISHLAVTGADTAGIHTNGLLNLDLRRVQVHDNPGAGISHGFGALTVSGSNIHDNGGGIETFGVAYISDTDVTFNRARSGAGVFVSASGEVHIADSSIVGNLATSGGGGIFVNRDATRAGVLTIVDTIVAGNLADVGGGIVAQGAVTIARSSIAGNHARLGGGIYREFDAEGTTTITRTTITDNRATEGYGGGLSIRGGETSISRSTISGNTATGNAGGMRTDSALSLTNSTVSGNRADGRGGGLDISFSDDVTIESSTITRNVADADGNAGGGEDGGGIASGSGPTIRNSIIAENTDASPTGNQHDDCTTVVTPLVSEGVNLVQDPTGCLGLEADDITGMDPRLRPLANNGGGTPTHALAPSGPAVDAAGAGCPALDQRGAPRDDCSIGAYELVRCGGVIVNRVGTPGADALEGTGGSDGFLMLAGVDFVKARDGRDAACGGGGGDRLEGGPGNDELFGQGGNDRLVGEAGDDLLNGGPGDDACVGGTGEDRLFACEP